MSWRHCLIAMCCVAGCTGQIADPTGSEGHADPGGSAANGAGDRDGGDGTGPGQTLDGGAFGPAFVAAPASLSRLTVTRYRNTVEDLFGDITLPEDLEEDTSLKGFTSIGAASVTIAPTTAEKLENAALGIAQQIFSDSQKRETLVGCAPASASDACIRTFIGSFGLRAWRRPLEASEIDALAALAKDVGDSFADVWTGLEYTTAAMLQSPYFLFRVDRGEVDPERPERRRYSAWEMASRLSFVLWDTTPDDELLDAAESGELVTLEGVREQAERLIGDARFRPALTRYFTENLALERLDSLSKDPDVYPQMTDTLPTSMRGELTHLFEQIVFEDEADFRDILDTNKTFVNRELASLYDVSAPGLATDDALDKFVQVDSPDTRRGLLTTAGILATYANTTTTSPTRRGKFVRSRLLCDEIPPPPEGVITMLPPAKPMQTMRERLEIHASNKTCATCHVKMDPIGLALEHFDGIGVYRDDDQGAQLDVTGDIDGAAFDGAVELAAALKDNAGVSACIVQGVYRFALGHTNTPGEQPVIDALTEELIASGHRLDALVLALVLSDGFRYVGEPE